jgi:hypothetical protein
MVEHLYNVKVERTVHQELTVEVQAENEDQARRYAADDLKKYRTWNENGRVFDIDFVDSEFEIKSVELRP